MTSLSSILAATKDADLTDRMVAAAALAGVPGDPVKFVYSNLHALAVAPLESGNTVAAVYEYAMATYTPAPTPGANPAAVTDAQLIEAVNAVAGKLSGQE